MYFCCFMCWWNILFYMREYSDAIKVPKSYPRHSLGGGDTDTDSFQMSKENIKHGSITLWRGIVFDFECKSYFGKIEHVTQSVNVLVTKQASSTSRPHHLIENCALDAQQQSLTLRLTNKVPMFFVYMKALSIILVYSNPCIIVCYLTSYGKSREKITVQGSWLQSYSPL